MTLCNNQPVAWVLYQWVIDQSNADIFIKPGIITFIGSFFFFFWIAWHNVQRSVKQHTGIYRIQRFKIYRPIDLNNFLSWNVNWYWIVNIIQLLHLNEINMRFYGAEYNNIERGKDEFNIVVLCSIKPHIDQVQV